MINNTNKGLYRNLILILIDATSIILSLFGSLVLRYNGFSYIDQLFINNALLISLPLMILSVVIFHYVGLYRIILRYTSINELKTIVISCLLSFVLLLVTYFTPLYLPRTCYIIYLLLLLVFIGGIRLVYRLITIKIDENHLDSKDYKKVMVIGAGDAGETTIREINKSKFVSKEVKCLIDDNPRKWGRSIHGIKVVGGKEKILESVEKFGIEEIYIAIPSASRREISSIVDICKETKCRIKILPGIYQLMNDDIKITDYKDVEIEDLLNRDQINTNLNEIMSYVSNKTVLVTGGGGSIGSELCRQIAKYNPKQLVIFDIYENNAYSIEQELKITNKDLNLKVCIGSVRDKEKVESLFNEIRPDIVYHAAAHKHVPLMEDSPREAVKNNVFGTLNVVEASDKYGVKRFIMISTDKAVNPTNVMGATKRICEMIIQSYDKKSKTEFVAVRFGNVLGSNGSVIPLFKKQIIDGGPVTVTDPNIIRYFMTIPEAVSLVLQAGAYAKGGEIFVLDMGKPVKIDDLARNLIKLSGYTPDEDIEIKYIGLRPGEKLYEEMLMDEEGLKETPNHMIHIGQPLKINDEEFYKALEELEIKAHDETSNIKEEIKKICTTYKEAN